jgi:phage tail tape-measure protein
MSRKKFIILGMFIGSVAGGYAPLLLGADSIFVSIVGSTVGGILGIWLAFKLYG